MRKVREVLRLRHALSLSYREISEALGVGKTAAGEIVRRAEVVGLTWPLPQLFACLAVKEMMKRSYREAEALLVDADHWCKAIGMRRVPDHNTLCRAAKVILTRFRTDKLLDVVARWAATARILRLSLKPLAGDGTHFEDRHVSRHFECRRGRGTGPKGRRRKAKSLPKLAVEQGGGLDLGQLRLAVAGSVAGRVLLDGRPIPSAGLQVIDADGNAVAGIPVARSDGNGRYVLPYVFAGSVMVQALFTLENDGQRQVLTAKSKPTTACRGSSSAVFFWPIARPSAWARRARRPANATLSAAVSRPPERW